MRNWVVVFTFMFTFKSVFGTNRLVPQYFPTVQNPGRIYGGTEAELGQFDEVIQLKSTFGSCSSTLIGPKVLLSAGHCKYMKSATFNSNDYKLASYDTVPGFYLPKTVEEFKDLLDVSIGILEVAIPDVKPVSIQKEGYEQGQEMILAGWGANQDNPWSGSGTLRYGNTSIHKLKGNSIWLKGGETGNGVLVFPGDSGGPMFFNQDGKRSLIGVISALLVDHETKKYHGSLGTLIGTNEVLKFLQATIEEYEVEICGFNLDCSEM